MNMNNINNMNRFNENELEYITISSILEEISSKIFSFC